MKMLKPIVDTINEIRNEYPIIGNELDGKIYYMNGNDGTDFDWKCNGRTCEFMVFNDNEMGYIKLDINKSSGCTSPVVVIPPVPINIAIKNGDTICIILESISVVFLKITITSLKVIVTITAIVTKHTKYVISTISLFFSSAICI